jgi:uncharacterized membrane protein YdjX (TVP38/TMEM64 family)
VKQVLDWMLDGKLLTPALASVLGCIFGLLAFVVLTSQGIEPKMHWGIAIVVALVAGIGINLFLKPGAPVSDSHH